MRQAVDTTNTPFNVQMRDMGLTSASQIRTFLQGKQAIIIANRGGHNYGSIGDIFTFDEMLGGGTTSTSTVTAGMEGSRSNTIRFDEFSVITQLTKEMLVKKLEVVKVEESDILARKESLARKIQYLEDENLEAFDEDEYKMHQAKKLINSSDLSDEEKLKLIMGLIKG